MQIVIDIPEKIYNFLQDFDTGVRVDRAIAKGIVLPKGHGRIADMDAAIKCIEEVEGEDAVWAIGLIEWACGKRTLIEADTESEVEECR